MDHEEATWQKKGRVKVSPTQGKAYSYSGICEFQGRSYFIQLYNSKEGGLQGPIKVFPKRQVSSHATEALAPQVFSLQGDY